MKKCTANLTVDEVKSLLTYSEDTGELHWLVQRNHKTKAGHLAGYRRPDGHIVVKINGHNYLGHHLAWVIVYGVWPVRLDHRDLDPSNNRLLNLREATQSQNKANGRLNSNNTAGFKGVTLDKRRAVNPWKASIKVNYKTINLGTFATAEEAHAAYATAAQSAFG
jgi:hypothetical protein